MPPFEEVNVSNYHRKKINAIQATPRDVPADAGGKACNEKQNCPQWGEEYKSHQIGRLRTASRQPSLFSYAFSPVINLAKATTRVWET